MKIVYSKWFPPFKFTAINLFGVLIVKSSHENFLEQNQSHPRIKRWVYHEIVHSWQMSGLLYVPFYLLYFIEWFVKLFSEGKAYKRLSFEREAKIAQEDYPMFWNAMEPVKDKRSGYIYREGHSKWYKYIFHQ